MEAATQNGEGGRTAVFHSGPRGPGEWAAKYSAVLPGLCNQNTEGTSVFPPRRKRREALEEDPRALRLGHKLSPADVLML